MKLFKLLTLFLLGFLLNSQNTSAQTLADLSGVTLKDSEQARTVLTETINAINNSQVSIAVDKIPMLDMQVGFYHQVIERLVQDQPVDTALMDAYNEMRAAARILDNTPQHDAAKAMFFATVDLLKG